MTYAKAMKRIDDAEVAASGSGPTRVERKLGGFVSRWYQDEIDARMLAAICSGLTKRDMTWPYREAPATADVVIASIASLAAESVMALGRIDVIVIDEGHHGTAATYRQAIAAAQTVNPACWVAGLTATDIRSDGQSLDDVLGPPVVNITPRMLIQGVPEDGNRAC